MKIIIDDIHVKTIPAKYIPVFTKKYILNYSKKRLTTEERQNLDTALIDRKLQISWTEYKEDLKGALKELAESVNCLHIRLVTTRSGHYYEYVTDKKGITFRMNNIASKLCTEEINRAY